MGGLVSGSGLLVWETRMALRILGEEVTFMLSRTQALPQPPSDAANRPATHVEEMDRHPTA